jgi:hypothetical protein
MTALVIIGAVVCAFGVALLVGVNRGDWIRRRPRW